MSQPDQAFDIQEHKAQIKKTFDTVASEYGRGGCRFFHSCGEYLAGTLPLEGDESVLDLAAGTGATAIPLAKRLLKGRVTCIDLSAVMLSQAQDYAKAHKLENVETSVGDFTDLPFPANHFDHATCSFGLFFVPEMVEALSHIGDKVKKGGSVTVSGFCGESFMPVAQLCLDRLRSYGLEIPEQIAWRRMSEPEQLHNIFAQAGLESLAIDRKSFGYHVSPEEWWEVIWNAGFRGLVSQLGEQIEQFKAEHLNEVTELAGPEGLWLEIDVNFSTGICQ